MKEPEYIKATEENQELCSLIAMEECAELIQAISKAKRDKLNKDNLTEEIADVFICIDWLCEIYNIKNEEISEWLITKKDRISKRLKCGNFK